MCGWHYQGPRSNFEIGRGGGGGGGEGTISDSILGGGGKRHVFLLNLYNFKNTGRGHVPPLPPPPPTSRSLTMNTFNNQVELKNTKFNDMLGENIGTKQKTLIEMKNAL